MTNPPAPLRAVPPSGEPASDAQVLARLARDPDALGILYDRHASLVYGLALSVLRDASDSYGPFTPNERPGEAFLDTLRDDLNTPVALAEFNRVARQLANADSSEAAQAAAGELLADAALIGLFQSSPAEWFSGGASDDEADEIESLIEQRNTARAGKDWARADEIRDQLTAMGILLEDAGGMTRWRRKDG